MLDNKNKLLLFSLVKNNDMHIQTQNLSQIEAKPFLKRKTPSDNKPHKISSPAPPPHTHAHKNKPAKNALPCLCTNIAQGLLSEFYGIRGWGWSLLSEKIREGPRVSVVRKIIFPAIA